MNDAPLSASSAARCLNGFERFALKSVWPGYIGFLLALIYAVFVRFYEAAAGIIGGFGEPADPHRMSMASYVAGVLIMLCGFILLGLVRPWGRVIPGWVPLAGGRKIPRLMFLVPTLVCAAFLIAHGITGIVTKALFLAGAVPIELEGWVVVDMHSLALWDLVFYEPWFLMMGVLAGLTAAHYAMASGVSQYAFRRGTVLYVLFVLLLSTLFTASIVFDFAHAISF